MLSRVADSLYWMSRYLERAEHIARVMEVHLNLMLESDDVTTDQRWPRVLCSLGHSGPVPDDAFAAAQTFALDEILSCVNSARENGRQVREQISSEMWEQLNRLFHEVRTNGVPDMWNSRPADFLAAVNDGSHLFQGVTDSTMNHGEGWHFIQVGRNTERASGTALLLDIHLREFMQSSDENVDSAEHTEWAGLLRSCTALEAYCKVYTADLRYDRVAEFLLLNPEFPHSIRFAVDRVQESLDAVYRITGTRRAGNVAKLAGRLSANLSYTPLEEIMAEPREFLADVQQMCNQIHNSIYNIYVHYPIEAALAAAK